MATFVFDCSVTMELAMRLKHPLATLDSDLRKAAKKVGIDCWPEKI